MEGNIDARIMLSTILVQEERIDEAITLLAPPKDSGRTFDVSYFLCIWKY